ncbi:MAG: hypothetical protein ABGY96_22585 [bacterium]|nr:hypothetical protein [Gammaproteobacteria bacterium]HIL97024.1 hypothetical protein [Pseudomonadales bacterium]
MKAPDKQYKSDSFKFLTGTISGIVLAIILASLYVKTGFQLPFYFLPAHKAKSTVVGLVTSLFVDEKELDELQREIALKIGENPNFYIEMDDALDNTFTEEIIWETVIRRKLLLLQIDAKNLQKQLDRGKFPALEESLNRLLTNMVDLTEAESYLVYDYLQGRFPGYSDREIIDALISMSQSELLEMPQSPLSRIVFWLRTSSAVKLEIYDTSLRNVKTLIDQALPAGKYRVYWDYTDNSGSSVDKDQAYHYKLLLNGDERKTKTIPKSSSTLDWVRQGK